MTKQLISQFWKNSTSEFSISDEARSILEKGLGRKYPEPYQRIKKEMGH